MSHIDQEHKLSAATPLVMRKTPKGDAKPYVLLEKGLSALIKHAVFYELAEIALEATENTDDTAMMLWSDGVAFSLVSDEGQQTSKECEE